MATVYCPYSDTMVPTAATSPEHIIPLSLGGDDRLVLPVQRALNCRLGAEIDGPLANEFLLNRKRCEYDARGHSGKAPRFVLKKARDVETGGPLQVTMGKALEIRDPITGTRLTGRHTFQASFRIDVDLPTRFIAKAFLSGGYFVYGERFRESVQHQQARLIMKGPLALSTEEARSITARCFDVYAGVPTGARQREEFQLEAAICQMIRGAVLVFCPGPRNLGIFGGVLGQYLGMLNVPADTSQFPRTGDFDLGHAIIVSNGNVFRWSYRRLLARVLGHLDGQKTSG